MSEATKFQMYSTQIGSLAHVNIWKQKLDRNQTEILHNDCTFTHCGDGVEWVDLREGTRGISRLRWPSGIENMNSRCFSQNDALVTCDKYCSFDIGQLWFASLLLHQYYCIVYPEFAADIIPNETLAIVLLCCMRIYPGCIKTVTTLGGGILYWVHMVLACFVDKFVSISILLNDPIPFINLI
mgnify:CR=1 FL=1